MTDVARFLEDRLAQDERLARAALDVAWHKRVWLRMRLILRKVGP